MTFVAVSKFKNVCGNLIHGYFKTFHAVVFFGLGPDCFIKIHSNMMLSCFCVLHSSNIACLLFDLRLGHFLFILHAHMRAI